MSRNILIGKIGKSLNFTTNNVNIARGAGNDIMFFSTVARMHPDWTLWIAGPNNLDKIINTDIYDKIFPYHNCKSVYAVNKNVSIENYNEYFKPIFDNIDNIEGKVDCALFFVGLVGIRNIKALLRTNKGTPCSPLHILAKYVGPYLMVLNRTGIPFYSIAEDARYITVNAKDLYNRERCIFTQYNGEIKTSVPHILNEDDIYTMRTTSHKAIYANTEKIPLLGVPIDWKNSIDIDKKINSPINKRFFVLSNGCGALRINYSGNNYSRLPVYKEWVHDITEGTEYEGAKVYGLWTDNVYEENPWIENKLIVDMKEEISECRYSLVYSQVRGFVTAKAYELICLGIIPFIHPDYDPERLLGLPEFLYIKTPDEMLSKIRTLDVNTNEYRKALETCMDVIRPEWQDGSLIINFIFNYISNDLGWDEYKDANGVDVIFNHFSNVLLR